MVKKLLISGVILSTILSMCLVVAPVKAAAVAGDLIKMDGLSSVYYLGADGKRYVFPNEQSYFSWYSDFSGVKTIPQSELESYPLGANVTIRPGTKLVKITTDPKVYAVEPGGVLRHIISETDAINLWGDMWSKRVVDVPDAFFVNYTQGSAKPEGVYPAGSLVKKADAPAVFYFDGTNFRSIASEGAFEGNRFKWGDIVTAPSTMTVAAGGNEITAAESDLTDTSSGAGGDIGAGTGLSVALSGSTAPSGTIIAGQAIANLGSFNVTASPDGDVKVTGITLKRTGVSADATLVAVYLYDGATRLTDSASVSSGNINFVNSSGIIVVPKGTTKTITAKANILLGTSGQTVGVSINASSDITTNGAVVSGSFPMSGNMMSIAQASLATFDMTSSSILPTTNTAVPVQNDYVMFQENVTVGTRAVDLKSIAFRQVGSVQSADLENFRLFIDGTQVGSAVQSMDGNGYVTFDLTATPKRLETGSRVVKMVGDIKNGSNRNFSFSIRQAADVMVVDTEYNANVLATVNAGTFTSQTTGIQTISVGTLTITKSSTSPSGNVLQNGAGVTLAEYTLEANGEAVKIDTIRAYFSSASTTLNQLRNGKLTANGVQIGSTADLKDSGSSPAYTEYTVNYTVNPGTPVTLAVIADIYDNESGAFNDAIAPATFTVNLDAQTGNAQGMSSLQLINFPDTTDVPGNQLTIAAGSIGMAMTSTYGSQTVVVPQTTAYKIASFNVTGNSSEDVNLNTIAVSFATTTGSSFDASDDLYDVYVKYGSNTGSVKTSVADSNNSWSINYLLAKNANLTVEVYAKIRSTVTATHDIRSVMTVTGTTANSGQSATTGAINGQLIAAGNASVSVSLDPSSPVNMITVGNSTKAVGAYKFNAVNDAITVSEMVISFVNASNIATVNLKDGDTDAVILSKPGASTVTFSGLSIAVANNASKVVTVELVLGTVGTGAGTSGANVKATLDSYKYRPASTGAETPATPALDTNNMYVFKAIPTITSATLPTTILAEGNNTLSKFTVAADTNPIYWKKMIFTVATSSTGFQVSGFKLYEGSTEIAGTFSVSGSAVSFLATNEQSVSGSGEKTYSLKGSASSVATNDSVSTYIDASAAVAVTQQTAYAATTTAATFVWSDGSANAHGLGTSDWYDDYLVKNIPLDAQGLSK